MYKERENVSNASIGTGAFDIWKKDGNFAISTAALLCAQIVMTLVLIVPFMIVMLVIMTVVLGNVFSGDLYYIFQNLSTAIPAVVIGSIVLMILISPVVVFFRVGQVRAFINMVRREKFSFEDIFSGFNGLGRGLIIYFVNLLLSLLIAAPYIYLILGIYYEITAGGGLSIAVTLVLFLPTIPAIIYLFGISQAFNLLVEHGKDYSAKEALLDSMHRMKGKKLKFFLLILVMFLMFGLPLSIISMITTLSMQGDPALLMFGNVMQYVILLIQLVLGSFLFTVYSNFYVKLIADNEEEEEELNSPILPPQE